ncbi:uncharacterized protein LOC112342177 [Selaginella moellendorffii]|uniref:uncharacterized protein LOC112342177 n=1 Tax=Selaginella moellendorffii TaxID=88036 RepID=UPI000D1CD3E0|nr:uncharacterized protein LOC112342177 [Selaginella moellendorffii]|eukprot:XP_024519363.1 uncharacterized protein LOC112342177 [Selaginella moellendorffii]
MALFCQARGIHGASMSVPCGSRVWRRPQSVVCVKKKEERSVVWEGAESEIELDKSDLLQLKFSRLLGESRETSIAKVVAKKLNPHLNNLEIHKLVKKRGTDALMRLVSDSWMQRAAAATEPPEPKPVNPPPGIAALARAQAPEFENGGLIALAPKPPKPAIGPSEEEDGGTLDAAVNPEWMDTDISMEKFVKLLNERELDVMKKEDGMNARRADKKPAKKFDRRPRSSDVIGRRRRAKSRQMPFSTSANANRKLTKNKGKPAK